MLIARASCVEDAIIRNISVPLFTQATMNDIAADEKELKNFCHSAKKFTFRYIFHVSANQRVEKL